MPIKRVFVGSTSEDLKAHRAAVRAAIMKLHMYPEMMEDFPSEDVTPIEICKQRVRDSDVYVGIYAHRFGFVPDGQSKSITEMEYDWATEFKINKRIFVVDPKYEWPPEFYDSEEKTLKLIAFKERVGKTLTWTT